MKKCKHGCKIGVHKITDEQAKATNLIPANCECCKNDFWTSGYIYKLCTKCDDKLIEYQKQKGKK